jgi:taurine dioxygenase
MEGSLVTAYETLSVRRLSPHVGGEVSGIDLTRPLTNRQFDEITDALIQHGVIFFRKQPIDKKRLVDFGRHFGSLHIHSGFKGDSEFPEVRVIHADADSKHVAGEDWHTDSTCDPIPPLGSILHVHTLPPIGGDTIFASTYAAYDALSDRMKAYLEGLTATHDGRLAFGRFNPAGKYPISVHPVIARHPVTGRKVLYVNKGFTAYINELPPEESASVLQFLFSHVSQPHWSVRFKWEKDSIAFWDNRCTQHLAVWDYYPQVRTGNRVQINADRSMMA